jgi:hypothetical protein
MAQVTTPIKLLWSAVAMLTALAAAMRDLPDLRPAIIQISFTGFIGGARPPATLSKTARSSLSTVASGHWLASE